MRYREMLTISIALDRAGARSLHEQLADQISAAIDAGTLARDARMPSTRTLATLFGVSRGVTSAAYDLLTERGYVHARSGSGTYVLGRKRPSVAQVRDEEKIIDMRPGLPSIEALPIKAWRAAWRQASYQAPPVSGPPMLGLPQLRSAITAHLQNTRGLVAPEHQVVVTSGLTDGLRMVLDAIASPRVAMEHPAPPSLWRAPRNTPIPLQGNEIPAACGAIVVSPDGHSATGQIMPAERRRELAGWAEATGGRVVEVIWDNIVRADANRLPRLVTISPGTCVVGSFADLLTPAVQLGYVLLPRELTTRISHLNRPSYIMQAAAAQLITTGVATRLTHRIGQLRARKRGIVDSYLTTMDAAGGNALLRMGPGKQASDVAAALLRRGVRTETLAPYHFSSSRVPQALLLGYGHLPDPLLRQALSVIMASGLL
ncbi:PLP-dependent aminotransferase family protein [Actinocrispum sp. NPDC049592]|uniref:aminotransferase-like domain-containing protein n=1 Tax=Actinocrispum sp. NPDC049592 TaxID=3154835 RepID=UPI00343371E5